MSGADAVAGIVVCIRPVALCVSFLGANDWGWLGVLGVAGVGVGGGFSESAIGAAGVGALVAVAFFGGRCYFH